MAAAATGEDRAPAPREEVVRHLAEALGEPFCAEAGVVLADEPGPLWQLLVVAQLLSARIASATALATARELWRCGWTTPQATLRSTWRQRVDALGRGGYRRYDFSTATRLEANATLLQQRWDGDLRRLHAESPGDAAGLSKRLQAFDGIGPVGASIFLREAQAVWPDIRPHADALVLKGAAVAGLPTDVDDLAALVPPEEFVRLAAGLVRVARKPSLLRVSPDAR